MLTSIIKANVQIALDLKFKVDFSSGSVLIVW